MPKLSPEEAALTVLAQLNKDKPHGMSSKMWAKNAKRGGADNESKLMGPSEGGDRKIEFGNNQNYPLMPNKPLDYVGKMQNVSTGVLAKDKDEIISVSNDDLIRETRKFLSKIARSGFPKGPDPTDPNIMIDKANPRSKSGIVNSKTGRRPHKPIINGPPKPIIQPTISLAGEITKMKKQGMKLNDANLRGAGKKGLVGAAKGNGVVGAGKKRGRKPKEKVRLRKAGTMPRKKLTDEQLKKRKTQLGEWQGYINELKKKPFMKKLKSNKLSAGSEVRELVIDGGNVGFGEDVIYDFLNKAVNDRDEITLSDLEKFMDGLRLEINKVEKNFPLVSQKRQQRLHNEKKKRLKDKIRTGEV